MYNKTSVLTDTYLPSGSKAMQSAEIYAAGPGRVALFSRSSPDSSKPNEDCLAVIPVGEDSVVLVVADGLGGHSGGVTASLIAVTEMHAAIRSGMQNGNELREAILTGIENANHTILETTYGAASTIAVAEITVNQVRTYHAGDTEVFITGQRGKVKHQTLSHSPVSYAVEAGLMDEGQAIMHEERHIVSNVLGSRDMHVTIGSQIRMARYDTLLIASDGLFDNLQKSEITEIIRKGSLAACGQALVERATTRMMSAEAESPSKFDDLSFIMFRLFRKKRQTKPDPDEKL